MSTYELTIQFDNQGLATINAASQLVTLVKSVGNGRPVAWVAFHPMESNQVTWTETYSVYSSTTQIQDGAQIQTQSTQPAVGGNTYTFAAGQFGIGQANLPAASYGVTDNDPNFEVDGVQMITSGLYQGAVVNGQATQSPLNAVAVPYLETGQFTPVEVVQVFASSYQSNGLVISAVSSQALTVDFTSQLTQTIHYNDATNQFAAGAL
ncbi:MAG: hypothetical protein ACRDT2_08230 [Natronosporangium sp.]